MPNSDARTGIEVLPSWTQDAIPEACRSCTNILPVVIDLALQPDAIEEGTALGEYVTREEFLEKHITDKIKRFCEGSMSGQCNFDIDALSESTREER